MYPEVTLETNNLIYTGFIWFNQGISMSTFKVYQVQREKKEIHSIAKPLRSSAHFRNKVICQVQVAGTLMLIAYFKSCVPALFFS